MPILNILFFTHQTVRETSRTFETLHKVFFEKKKLNKVWSFKLLSGKRRNQNAIGGD